MSGRWIPLSPDEIAARPHLRMPAGARGWRRLGPRPPVNQACGQCRDDEGPCTCEDECGSIVCARGPWDEET